MPKRTKEKETFLKDVKFSHILTFFWDFLVLKYQIAANSGKTSCSLNKNFGQFESPREKEHLLPNNQLIFASPFV